VKILEISRINRDSKVSQEKKPIDNKKEFSQSFNFAREKRNEEELKKLSENIKKKGNRLAITKSFSDVKSYKDLIKQYLQSVLEYMYSLKKDISFWQTQYFIRVETIDEKLEELTKLFLDGEKENITIASKIDEISGLIVDIYK
jgi:uncharacterized protein